MPLAARMLPVIEDPRALDRYIAASQVGITLSSLILGAYAQASIAPRVAPLARAPRRSRPRVGAVDRGSGRAARADRARHDRRRAGPEIARAAEPDADRARHRAADAVVRSARSRWSIAVPQRQRRPAAAADGRRVHRAPACPLARRDRAADRGKPRRRPARTAGAGPTAPRAAARPAHRQPADGAARRDSRRSTSRRRSRTSFAWWPPAPTAGCPSIVRPLDDIVGILHTKDVVMDYVTSAGAGRSRRCSGRSSACARACPPISCSRSCATGASTRRWWSESTARVEG